MKKMMLVVLLATFSMSMSVFADYPEVIVDGQVALIYDDVVEVSIDDVDGVAQFNHESPQVTDVAIDGNVNVDEVLVNVNSLGNNFDSTVGNELFLIQGNQVGGQNVGVGVLGNEVSVIDVDVTAVNNNASVVSLEDLDLGNVQFNKQSPVVVDVAVVGNTFTGVGSLGGEEGDGHQNQNGQGHQQHGNGLGLGHNHGEDGSVSINPSVNIAAIGNNLNVESSGVVNLNSLQLNQGSLMSVSVDISSNVGEIGTIGTQINNIGNNFNADLSVDQ